MLTNWLRETYFRKQSESIAFGTSECEYALVCPKMKRAHIRSQLQHKVIKLLMAGNLRAFDFRLRTARVFQPLQRHRSTPINEFELRAAIVSVHSGQSWPVFRCDRLQRTLRVPQRS